MFQAVQCSGGSFFQAVNVSYSFGSLVVMVFEDLMYGKRNR